MSLADDPLSDADWTPSAAAPFPPPPHTVSRAHPIVRVRCRCLDVRRCRANPGPGHRTPRLDGGSPHRCHPRWLVIPRQPSPRDSATQPTPRPMSRDLRPRGPTMPPGLPEAQSRRQGRAGKLCKALCSTGRLPLNWAGTQCASLTALDLRTTAGTYQLTHGRLRRALTTRARLPENGRERRVSPTSVNARRVHRCTGGSGPREGPRP